MAAVQLFTNSLGLDVLGTDDHVLYKCSCDNFKPVTKLYFCRHCTKLRCSQCISHEVDSYYCPNCLENMPSAEAKLKKNRCGNCFDCPSCGHTLSVRATAVIAQSPGEDPGKGSVATAKKMHYLMCSFCRWSSRDVGLPDQPTASGGWPELEPPSAKKIASLVDYYKQVAHQEKVEKEKKKITKRKAYFQFMTLEENYDRYIASCEAEVLAKNMFDVFEQAKDRHGLILSPGKKRSGSGLTGGLTSFSKVKNDDEFKPPVISESLMEVDDLPDSFYTDKVNLDEVLSVNQRLTQLGRQSTSVRDLYPRHKQMLVRRSQRCRECEHNLSKPEFNPSSIKFKLHLGACLYVPKLRIAEVPTLEKGKECTVVFSVTNPLDSVVDITFVPLEEEELSSYETSGVVSMPNVAISLAAKDATNEFDDIESSTDVFHDDSSVVKHRQMNKVWFYAKLTPRDAVGDIKTLFKMKYEYKTTVSSIPRPSADLNDKKEPAGTVTVSLEVLVRCKFGTAGDLSQANLSENKLATFV